MSLSLTNYKVGGLIQLSMHSLISFAKFSPRVTLLFGVLKDRNVKMFLSITMILFTLSYRKKNINLLYKEKRLVVNCSSSKVYRLSFWNIFLLSSSNGKFGWEKKKTEIIMHFYLVKKWFLRIKIPFFLYFSSIQV